MFRFGVDIGGTFTDFTCLDEESGVLHVEKVLTTPSRPQEAVMTGVELLRQRGHASLSDASAFVHATTLVTNLVLEGKGGGTALITTEGFSDILEIGREYRYDVYDLDIMLPRSVIPRQLRFGVPERIAFDGTVVRELDLEAVRRLADRLAQMDVQAVAICYLHAYANPDHEIATARIIAECCPHLFISMSHEVHPEPKEYERTSTTALDAYVKPVVRRYLDGLATDISQAGSNAPFYVMLSNGGAATVDTVSRFPIQIIESGPAAGVEAAAYYAQLLGIDRALSFDMGGTTAKLCLINKGVASRAKQFEANRVHRFKAGSGLPVAIPVFDLLEIGAGGGSIARITEHGLFQVGPQSASSSPGPACYGLGGENPTVTDADLLIGFLSPDAFLGGDMALDVEAAADAMQVKVGGRINLSAEDAALGVHDLVNETMASAARVYCAEKGEHPGELTLIAFGGAGPVHAVGLARRLGCPRVVIPPYPGVMSSFGLLVAENAFEQRKAFRTLLTPETVGRAFDIALELEKAASALLPEGSKEVSVRRFSELRHWGQDHALEIELPAAGASAVEEISGRFAQAYSNLYGKVDDDNAIEFSSIRVQVSAKEAKPRLAQPGSTHAAATGSRKLRFAAGEWLTVPIYKRHELGVDQSVEGPAVFEERESTTVIGPGDSAIVDATGSIIVTLRKESAV